MMFIDVPLYFLTSPRLDIVMVFQVLGILAFFKDGCRCDLVTSLVCCKLLSAFFPLCSRVSSLSSLPSSSSSSSSSSLYRFYDVLYFCIILVVLACPSGSDPYCCFPRHGCSLLL